MLVLLAVCALVSQVSLMTTTQLSQSTISNWNPNACALVVCGPAERGLPGQDGKDGKPGLPGPKGVDGLQGPKGIAGPPGKMGPGGQTGERGSPGEKGEKGDLGAMGPRGIRGLQGPPGSIGPPGSRGDIGPPGVPGVKGLIGPRGLAGAPGLQGQAGTPGPKGDRGSEGEKGAKGDGGAKGLPGAAGVQGPAGKTGSPGLKGDKGSTGEQGTKGDSGLSEINFLKTRIDILEGQLRLLQANLLKFQKVVTFPSGQIVGNKVYVTSGYEGTFDDLKQRCLQAGAQLASPRNIAENNAVQQFVVLHNKPVFLGINDIQTEGSFKYLNGDPIIYSNWQQGEPNNDKGRENCVEVLVNGKWNDRPCGERRLILCEF